MRKLIFILGLLSISMQGFGQVSATAALDKADILIGDQVNLSVSIHANPGVELQGVDFSILEQVDKVELVSQDDLLPGKDPQSGLFTQDAIITVFDSGYFKIPPLPVIFESGGRVDTAFTGELGLIVKTMPVRTDSLEVMPIKDIIKEPLKLEDAAPYFIGAAVILALFALVNFFVRRKKKKISAPKPAPVIPAHIIALEKLEKLRQAKLWQRGEVKAYESQLTYILWEYLEKRYGIKAIESTTDEIMRDLQQLEIKEEWKTQLGDIFRTADLVKFAKAKPPETIYDQVMDQVITFVRGTKKIVAEPQSQQA